MHRDQKIGLSLAVLIVGFTAAFCFRNEPLRDAQPLALDQATALDSRIERLPVRAYTQREGVGGIPTPSDLLDPTSDLVDSSLIERPAEPMQVGTATDGDVIELYAGPPEPLSTADAPDPSRRVDLRPAVEPHSDSRPTSPTVPMVRQAETTEKGSDKLTDESLGVFPQDGAAPSARSYVVKSGDTLSGVSQQIYGTTRRYLDIYRANRDVLRDPNDLPVGTTLRIP